jgi:hypothetical protein
VKKKIAIAVLVAVILGLFTVRTTSNLNQTPSFLSDGIPSHVLFADSGQPPYTFLNKFTFRANLHLLTYSNRGMNLGTGTSCTAPNLVQYIESGLPFREVFIPVNNACYGLGLIFTIPLILNIAIFSVAYFVILLFAYILFRKIKHNKSKSKSTT